MGRITTDQGTWRYEQFPRYLRGYYGFSAFELGLWVYLMEERHYYECWKTFDGEKRDVKGSVLTKLSAVAEFAQVSRRTLTRTLEKWQAAGLIELRLSRNTKSGGCLITPIHPDHIPALLLQRHKELRINSDQITIEEYARKKSDQESQCPSPPIIMPIKDDGITGRNYNDFNLEKRDRAHHSAQLNTLRLTLKDEEKTATRVVKGTKPNGFEHLDRRADAREEKGTGSFGSLGGVVEGLIRNKPESGDTENSQALPMSNADSTGMINPTIEEMELAFKRANPSPELQNLAFAEIFRQYASPEYGWSKTAPEGWPGGKPTRKQRATWPINREDRQNRLRAILLWWKAEEARTRKDCLAGALSALKAGAGWKVPGHE